MYSIIVLWVQTMRVVDCSVQHYSIMGSDYESGGLQCTALYCYGFRLWEWWTAVSSIIVLWVQTMRVVDCSVEDYSVMGSDHESGGLQCRGL